MTIDDLIYLIGKLTVEREALLKRIDTLEEQLKQIVETSAKGEELQHD